MLEVHGPVAWLGVQTVDRRVVTELRIPDLPLTITYGVMSKPAGEITSVSFNTYGVVWAEGLLEPDVWAEVAVASMTQTGPTSVAPTGIFMDRCQVMTGGLNSDNLTEVMSGDLMGVTVYKDSAPAWPDAHLRLK